MMLAEAGTSVSGQKSVKKGMKAAMASAILRSG